MSRSIRALALAVIVGASGCGEREYSAPRDLDNACSILQQRPSYQRAFKETERTWGVPVAVQMAIMYQESKFIGNARTPHQYMLGVIPVGRQSSAYGYSQALDGTWEEYQDERGVHRAKRDDIYDATDFMGWYMTQTTASLGIPLYDTRDQYLAYHEGRTGYANASYNDKGWLVRIADDLDERAAMYDAQLQACGRA
jgi:hypothetical protein